MSLIVAIPGGGVGGVTNPLTADLDFDTFDAVNVGDIAFALDDLLLIGEPTVAPKTIFGRELSIGSKATLQTPSSFQPNWIDIQESLAAKTVDGLRIITENTDGNITALSRALYLKTVPQSPLDGNVLTLERDTSILAGKFLPAAFLLGDVYASNMVTTSIGGSLTLESTGVTRATELYALILGAKGATGKNYALLVQDGDVVIDSDNGTLFFGENQDASIKYDAVDVLINPKVVGTGEVKILGNLAIGDNSAADPVLTARGSTNSGTLTWDESEPIWLLADRINFQDKVGFKSSPREENLVTIEEFNSTGDADGNNQYLLNALAIAESSVETTAERTLYGGNFEVKLGAGTNKGRNFRRYTGGNFLSQFSQTNDVDWTSSKPRFTGGVFSAWYNGTGKLTNASGSDTFFTGADFSATIVKNPSTGPVYVDQLWGASAAAVCSVSAGNMNLLDVAGLRVRADVAGANVATRVYGILLDDIVGAGGSTVWGINCMEDIQVYTGKHLILEGSKTSKGDTRISYDLANTRMDFEVNAVSNLLMGATTLGFYGTAPVSKPTVTGSRGGNAALASALTALASLGLITDSSTA